MVTVSCKKCSYLLTALTCKALVFFVKNIKTDLNNDFLGI